MRRYKAVFRVFGFLSRSKRIKALLSTFARPSYALGTPSNTDENYLI